MTTTAFDDQFTVGTQTIEPVRQPYDTVAILRRNIADMEVALRTQTERAEAAEAELAKLREQKPVAWMREDGNLYLAWQKDLCLPEVRFSPLYASPIPAPAVPADWRKVMAELLTNDGADGCRYDANKWLAARDKARALLQSAEARHD